jgi:protein-ribulosamine 3-kinase
MPNAWETSWAEFFAQHRLRAILDKNYTFINSDREIEDLARRCAAQVVPRLLGGLEDVKPVLVHGDLLALVRRV